MNIPIATLIYYHITIGILYNINIILREIFVIIFFDYINCNFYKINNLKL